MKAVQAHGLTAHVRPPPPAASAPEPDRPPAGAGPPKRIRDRTAERRAKAAAEAAKANGQDKTSVTAAPDALDEDDPLMGAADAAPGADPFDDDPMAEVDDTAPLPPGPDRKPAAAAAKAPAPPAKTEKEYMEGSLILLRQCYGAPGGWEQVKIVQKEFKVSKFLDVPLDRAADLYKRARALAQTMGVQIPPGV